MINRAHRLVNAPEVAVGQHVQTEKGVVIVEAVLLHRTAEGEQVTLAGNPVGRKAKMIKVLVDVDSQVTVIASPAELDAIEAKIVSVLVEGDAYVAADGETEELHASDGDDTWVIALRSPAVDG